MCFMLRWNVTSRGGISVSGLSGNCCERCGLFTMWPTLLRGSLGPIRQVPDMPSGPVPDRPELEVAEVGGSSACEVPPLRGRNSALWDAGPPEILPAASLQFCWLPLWNGRPEHGVNPRCERALWKSLGRLWAPSQMGYFFSLPLMNNWYNFATQIDHD